MDYASNHWQLIAVVILLIILAVSYRWLLGLCGVIMVPDDSVGVLTKKFVLVGKNRRLPAGRIIALNGEAGYQADTLPPGLHMGLWPWQFQVDTVKFCTVPPGKVGGSSRGMSSAIHSKTPLPSSRAAGSVAHKWPSLPQAPTASIRLFSVQLAEALDIPDNKVGIVTTREGLSLAAGEIAGRVIDRHNMFQSPQVFVDGKGSKGLQEQVLLAGVAGGGAAGGTLVDVLLANVIRDGGLRSVAKP